MSLAKKNSRSKDFITWSEIELASAISIDTPRRCSPDQTSLLGRKDPKVKSSLKDGGRTIGGIRSSRKGRTVALIIKRVVVADAGETQSVETAPRGEGKIDGSGEGPITGGEETSA